MCWRRRWSGLGFRVTRLRFGEIENLFARIGSEGPHLCFAGHTDVVPSGDGELESRPVRRRSAGRRAVRPRRLRHEGRDRRLRRGHARLISKAAVRGSISLLITGDEEGPALDGTVKVLDWMKDHGEVPDFCVVGEPTNPAKLGEVIKIGRRGSLNAAITVHGIQGHAAYPARADNPVHRLAARAGGADGRTARCRQRLVRAVDACR